MNRRGRAPQNLPVGFTAIQTRCLVWNRAGGRVCYGVLLGGQLGVSLEATLRGGPSAGRIARVGDELPPFAPEQIRAQVAKIVQSEGMARAGRTRSLLEFLVEQALAGRAKWLKQYVI